MPSENNFKRFFLSRWFLLGGIVVALFIAFVYARAYYQDYQVRREIQNLQDEVKRLKTKKLEMLELLRYVKSTDFVEEKARTELNLAKPGEHVAIFGSDTPELSGGQVEERVVELDKTLNYIKWWRFFVNRKKS